MSSRGLFITLEGIDGAGKSSHIASLESLFQAQGRTVLRTREPGGTPLAEALRGLILQAPMDALTESLLVFAARRDHIVQVIAPALGRGDVVVCDRFSDATFAYQGAGRGFGLDVLSKLEHWTQVGYGLQPDSLLEPDLTLWFDLAPEVAAQRLAGARLPDRFESQPVEFFRRVASGYAQRAEGSARFERIESDRPHEVVGRQIAAALARRGLIE